MNLQHGFSWMLVFLIALSIIIYSPISGVEAAGMQLEKSTFARNEAICFTTSGFTGAGSAEIFLTLTRLPNMHKGGVYYPLFDADEPKSDGRRCVMNENPPADYELRLYLKFKTGSETLEATSRLTITDKDAATPTPAPAPKIWLSKATFYPNEQIRVIFHAPSSWPKDAWIGIIPSNIPHGDEALNDRHDVAYQFIDKRTSGMMIFNAPGPGQWDFRMHDTDQNGREFFSISFTVR